MQKKEYKSKWYRLSGLHAGYKMKERNIKDAKRKKKGIFSNKKET